MLQLATMIILLTLSLINGQPVDTKDVIYVPQDIKYVPIDVIAKKSSNTQPKPKEPEESSTVKQLGPRDGEISFDLFEDKFDVDKSISPEEYVLAPIYVLRKVKDQSEDASSASETHILTKRQAPGNGPVLRSALRFRPPAFVGYLNNYDQFPTVA